MQIRFIPGEIVTDLKEKETVLDAAIRNTISLDASCAGKGTCGRCRVLVKKGSASTPDKAESDFFTKEELDQGWRLACRMIPTSDMTIEIPDINKDTGRKKSLMSLPEGFLIRAEEVVFGENISYGIAFDIGTTTVVGALWDLNNHKLIDTEARTNPQTVYGADVISRILFSSQEPENRGILQKQIIECFQDILDQFVSVNKVDKMSIEQITVVGNTTMNHLFLGIDPASLAASPYEPGYVGPVSLTAESLGLSINENTMIHVLPNIAGHVGADIVGVLLASDLRSLKGANLAIDIGTNGEILLAKDGRVLTCSTAAGPAFEGASIKHGMRAAKGAIEGVRIHGGEVELLVIDNVAPIGICGSGLIDAIAEMFAAGLLSNTGRLLNQADAEERNLPKSLSDRLQKQAGGNVFVLYKGPEGKEIVICQKDVREVQLAKGAVAAGIVLLMNELKIEPEELDQVLLAGAFGNYIDKYSALTIGLLPNVAPAKIRSIGNGAGTGASMALLSSAHRELSNQLAKETEHIDLASHKDFQEIFLREMYFKV